MKRIELILTAILFMALPMFSQNVHIPDEAFLYALLELGVDTDGNTIISYEEAEVVSSLDFSRNHQDIPLSPLCIGKSDGIINLTGIEAFINLDTLICSFNFMCNPNLSKNAVLK